MGKQSRDQTGYHNQHPPRDKSDPNWKSRRGGWKAKKQQLLLEKRFKQFLVDKGVPVNPEESSGPSSSSVSVPPKAEPQTEESDSEFPCLPTGDRALELDLTTFEEEQRVTPVICGPSAVGTEVADQVVVPKKVVPVFTITKGSGLETVVTKSAVSVPKPVVTESVSSVSKEFSGFASSSSKVASWSFPVPPGTIPPATGPPKFSRKGRLSFPKRLGRSVQVCRWHRFPRPKRCQRHL